MSRSSFAVPFAATRSVCTTLGAEARVVPVTEIPIRGDRPQKSPCSHFFSRFSIGSTSPRWGMTRASSESTDGT